MPIRNAVAVWEGDFKGGRGQMSLGSGAFKGSFSAASRFEQGAGTNPEELIGAAHAGCFSMSLALLLQGRGYTARQIHTVARVRIEKTGSGYKITNIDLETEGMVADVAETEFMSLAEEAKAGCPVSQALAGVPITLTARLVRAMAA